MLLLLIFCWFCSKIVKPWQLSELSLDNRPLSRALPLGSGQLSGIIPRTHGLTITCELLILA